MTRSKEHSGDLVVVENEQDALVLNLETKAVVLDFSEGMEWTAMQNR